MKQNQEETFSQTHQNTGGPWKKAKPILDSVRIKSDEATSIRSLLGQIHFVDIADQEMRKINHTPSGGKEKSISAILAW